MSNKIITLLTDFGTVDPYVSIMKGVILSINANVKIIDISHDIPKFNIKKAAFILANAAKYFPKNSIHVVVIDPGVGTERLPLLIKTKNYYLIGPDNGVLSLLAFNDGIEKIIALENKKYFRSEISSTFHGRDIFAPVAAYLSKGININEFGIEIDNFIKLNEYFYKKPKILNENEILLNIIDVDGFGNIITNIPEKMIINLINKIKNNKKINNIILKFSRGNKFNENDSLSNIEFPFKKAYNEVKIGEFLSLIGSHGNLEISKNQDNAAKNLKISPGEQLVLKIFIN